MELVDASPIPEVEISDSITEPTTENLFEGTITCSNFVDCVTITITDKDGNPLFDTDYEVTCRVYKGKLLAFFSGNPKSEDDVSSNKCHTFDGHALAIVSADTPDDLFVTFYGEGLAGQTVKITAI